MSNSDSNSQNNQTQQEIPPITSKKRLLIVEDDNALVDALKETFTEEGYEVMTAKNGQEGLDTAQTFHPDIILLDLLMPVMTGQVMLRKLREIPEFAYTPAIVLTNAGQTENIQETVRFDHATGFLIKSNVSLDEIVDRVKNSY